MTVAERIIRCRLIEKMEKNELYAKKLGIRNVSTFRENSNAYNEMKR